MVVTSAELVEVERVRCLECGMSYLKPCGADRELEPAVPGEGERRRHHALHPRAGHERLPHEVGLAEHAVQMQVEAP